MSKRIYSLDEICFRNNYVLLDNCAIESYSLNKFADSENMGDKIKDREIVNRRYGWWKENYEKHKQLFVTKYVIDEIRNTNHYGYRKIVKKSGGRSPNLLEYRRAINSNQQRKKKLADFFKKERFLDLRGECETLYDCFSEPFLDLKGLLGETDFDLLVSASILNAESNRVAIISMDRNMFRTWNNFNERREKHISFYVPETFDGFVKY